jgi:hypothetical protein
MKLRFRTTEDSHWESGRTDGPDAFLTLAARRIPRVPRFDERCHIAIPQEPEYQKASNAVANE